MEANHREEMEQFQCKVDADKNKINRNRLSNHWTRSKYERTSITVMNNVLQYIYIYRYRVTILKVIHHVNTVLESHALLAQCPVAFSQTVHSSGAILDRLYYSTRLKIFLKCVNFIQSEWSKKNHEVYLVIQKLFKGRLTDCLNRTNQRINQSTNYQLNQLTINQSTNKPINQSIYQSINLSIYHSINLSIYQSINLSISQ